MDEPEAVTAAAQKPARLIDAMPTKGEDYAGHGQDDFEQRYRHRVLPDLERRAQQLGRALVPNPEAPGPA